MRKLIAALCVAGVMLAGAGPALAAKPSQNAKAERLCEKEGGLFIDLGGIAYACVLPTQASDKDIRKAQALCGRQGGLFASVGNVVYACVLPGTELPVGGLPIPGTDDGSGGVLRILPVLLGGGVLIGPGGPVLTSSLITVGDVNVTVIGDRALSDNEIDVIKAVLRDNDTDVVILGKVTTVVTSLVNFNENTVCVQVGLVNTQACNVLVDIL